VIKENIILFITVDNNKDNFFNEKARDNCNEPYITLKKRLLDYGYKLENANNQNLDSCRALFFWDSFSLGGLSLNKKAISYIKNLLTKNKRRNYFQEALKKQINHKMFFFMVEPPVVCKGNSDHSYHKEFNKILTWEKSLVDNTKYIHCPLPYTSTFPKTELISFPNKKLLVDISGNKFSDHPFELYSERRKTVKYFNENHTSEFDLYGTGWDTNKYITYKGKVPHKNGVINHYKFVICYENMRDYPDYVSNRIFDVLNCFCVPIYWGAPNISEYVDENAYIDRRNFTSNAELAKYLKSMNENDYNNFIEAGQNYLHSEMFKLFSTDNFTDTILNVLELV